MNWARRMVPLKLSILSALILLLAPLGSMSLASAATSVIGTIAVFSPVGVGVNPLTNRIYVTSLYGNNLAIIDGSTNTVVKTVPVGVAPKGVGVNPVTNRIYVANNDWHVNTVSVIDGATDQVSTINVGSRYDSSPDSVAVNPNTNRIYVTNSGRWESSLSVIDGNINKEIATVKFGNRAIPRGVAVNPATNRIYVANNGSGSLNVVVIDGGTNQLVKTIPIGGQAFSMAANPSTNRIYVPLADSNRVLVIDGTKDDVVKTITVGSNPEGVAVNPVTNRIYVSNTFVHTVSIIDGANDEVIESVGVNYNPKGVGVNPRTNRAYVANSVSGNVSVLSDGAMSQPPTAVGDTYGAYEDTALNVAAAQGVLTNDSDPDGGTISSVLVAGPTRGTVTLNSSGSFVYAPSANLNGADSFTYKANDGAADSNVASVVITVNPVNDPPTFTKGDDQTVLNNVGPQSVSGWATNISGGPPDEAGQSLQFIVTNNSSSLFSIQPAMAANGTLSFTPASNASGLATVSVALKDNGGTANGGNDTSAVQTFSIRVKDATPPIVTANVVGTLGYNGWYVSDVTVSWSVTDPESAITLLSGCGETAVTVDTGPTGMVLTCSATSEGGVATRSVTIARDTTAPVVTASAQIEGGPYSAGAWTNKDVVVGFSCVEAGSGLAGACPSPVTFTNEGDSQSADSGPVCDAAGNCSGATFGTIRIDKTAPVLHVSSSPDTLWPANRQLREVTTVVRGEDNLSGMAAGSIRLLSIFDSDPNDGVAQRDLSGDIKGWEIGSFDTAGQLRAERSGKGSGRTYAITYVGEDLAGNLGTGSCIVYVPHDLRGGAGGRN